jgi:hypothetical protein
MYIYSNFSSRILRLQARDCRKQMVSLMDALEANDVVEGGLIEDIPCDRVRGGAGIDRRNGHL